MTAGAGVMGLGCRTDQGVVVAVGTTGRTNGDQTAVVEVGGRMQRIPVAAMAGRTVAAVGKVRADRRADQAAVRIVTAGAGVMGVCRGTDQGVVVAACTVGRTDVTRAVWSMAGVCSASQVPVWQVAQSPPPPGIPGCRAGAVVWQRVQCSKMCHGHRRIGAHPGS